MNAPDGHPDDELWVTLPPERLSDAQMDDPPAGTASLPSAFPPNVAASVPFDPRPNHDGAVVCMNAVPPDPHVEHAAAQASDVEYRTLGTDGDGRVWYGR